MNRHVIHANRNHQNQKQVFEHFNQFSSLRLKLYHQISWEQLMRLSEIVSLIYQNFSQMPG